jgi:hypothetical protein
MQYCFRTLKTSVSSFNRIFPTLTRTRVSLAASMTLCSGDKRPSLSFCKSCPTLYARSSASYNIDCLAAFAITFFRISISLPQHRILESHSLLESHSQRYSIRQIPQALREAFARLLSSSLCVACTIPMPTSYAQCSEAYYRGLGCSRQHTATPEIASYSTEFF